MHFEQSLFYPLNIKEPALSRFSVLIEKIETLKSVLFAQFKDNYKDESKLSYEIIHSTEEYQSLLSDFASITGGDIYSTYPVIAVWVFLNSKNHKDIHFAFEYAHVYFIVRKSHAIYRMINKHLKYMTSPRHYKENELYFTRLSGSMKLGLETGYIDGCIDCALYFYRISRDIYWLKVNLNDIFNVNCELNDRSGIEKDTYLLAVCLYNGEGVPPSLIDSYYWFLISLALLTDSDLRSKCLEYKTSIERSLTITSIVEIQSRVSEDFAYYRTPVGRRFYGLHDIEKLIESKSNESQPISELHIAIDNVNPFENYTFEAHVLQCPFLHENLTVIISQLSEANDFSETDALSFKIEYDDNGSIHSREFFFQRFQIYKCK